MKKIYRDFKKILDCQSGQKFHGNKIREVFSTFGSETKSKYFCGKPTVRSQRSRLMGRRLKSTAIQRNLFRRIKCSGLNGVLIHKA